MSVRLDDIPYRPDSCELFGRIRHLPRPVLLDSSYPHTQQGRYDILAAEPVAGVLPRKPDDRSEASARQYLAELARVHRDYFADVKGASPDLPFCGGIIGYLGYGFGEQLQGLDDSRAAAALSSMSL